MWRLQTALKQNYTAWITLKTRLTRSNAIRDYLMKNRIRKLHIGAGPCVMEGWLNVDLYPVSDRVIYLDARQPFPIEDSVFDYVFSEHQIEHLTFKEGMSMLREINRILKPRGKVRIATPDLSRLVRLYTSTRTNEAGKKYQSWIMRKFLPEMRVYGNQKCFVLNNAFRNWGHEFVYDRSTLRVAMKMCGFVNITDHTPGESDDELLQGLENHGKVIGSEAMNLFETMVLEARRA